MPNVYEIVTDRIVSLLEAGTVPWRKPWTGSADAPRNARGNLYRGINRLLLEPSFHGYADPRWLTFKQQAALGGSVKGQRSSIAVFYKQWEKETADGIERIPVLRYYNVFNAEQCAGVDLPAWDAGADRFEHDPIAAADAIVDGWDDRPGIRFIDRGQCYYDRLADCVTMVPCDRFPEAAEYYSALFHELVHATGSPNRLARVKGKQFGDADYAREELTAEIGASFLRASAGIDLPAAMDNSAAYIATWLKALKGDSRLVVRAAGAAQRATDLILGAVEADADAVAA